MCVKFRAKECLVNTVRVFLMMVLCIGYGMESKSKYYVLCNMYSIWQFLFRYMMLIDGPGHIYMFDRDNRVFRVSNLRFVSRKDLNRDLTKTLLDGVGLGFRVAAREVVVWVGDLHIDISLCISLSSCFRCPKLICQFPGDGHRHASGYEFTALSHLRHCQIRCQFLVRKKRWIYSQIPASPDFVLNKMWIND